MRSSVSVILSSPPPDTTMSYPDYQAHPHHHRSLLVLVAQLGTRVKNRSFQQLYERISRVNQLKVSDSGGTQRPVWVTYRREYPVENNDWGDFQTHRRLLAIITIGQVGSQNDLNEVCKQHESLKVKYAGTIYDSRCIILGLNSDGSVHTESGSGGTSSSLDEGSLGTTKQQGRVEGTGVDCQGDRDSGVYEHLPGTEDRVLGNGDHQSVIQMVNGHVPTAVVSKIRCDSSSQSDSGQSVGEGGGGGVLLKIGALSSSSSDSGSESTADGCCVADAGASSRLAADADAAKINGSSSPDLCTHNSLQDVSSSNCSSINSTDNSNNIIDSSINSLHREVSNTSTCSDNGNVDLFDSTYIIGINNFNSSSESSSNSSSGNTIASGHSQEQKSPRAILQPPSYFKTRAMFYPTSDHAVNIEATLHDFISSLFWVLESKRLDKSQEKLDRPPLLCAPFERKDLVGLDLDSRASRKRCVGRLKKQLGDLCLQVGLVGEAAQHYSQAADILRASNDWLWLAGCLEGSCAASAVQLYPELGRGVSGLHRNSSLGLGPPAQRHRQTNSLPSNSLPAGVSPAAPRHLSKHCLTPDTLVNKYREAIVHYSKYRNAGVVETEASIKAVYVLIEQRRYLLAAEFLSNVVFINLQLSDEEKIGRFRALAELYQELGMMRKAGFFRRVAAMRCAVAQTQRSHDWPQCYRLLLNTLPGYRLTLDPMHCINSGGWGALQVQVVQEVVGTSRRMGAHEACCRHQAFLLAALLHHLSPAQRQEAALMLHTLTQQAAQAQGGGSSTCSVVSGVVGSTTQHTSTAAAPHNLLPPVNLLNIPLCRSVKVLPPGEGRHLQKRAEQIREETSGPFIFSPFVSLNIANAKPSNAFDFQWIEGDVCEVVLQFENVLSIPLHLTNIRLLTEGDCQFESWSSSVLLEANSNSGSVTVRGQATAPGELRITGYSATAFGVTSVCRLKHLTHLKVQHYVVQVVPALPLLQVEGSSRAPDTDSATSGHTPTTAAGVGQSVEGGVGWGRVRGSLMAGETRELKLTLHNIAPRPVAAVTVTVKTKSLLGDGVAVLRVDEVSLQSQLPVPGNSPLMVTVLLYGQADFLASPQGSSKVAEDAASLGGHSASPSSIPSLPSVPPSRLGGVLSRSSQHRSSHHSTRSQSSGSLMSSHSTNSGNSIRSDRSGSCRSSSPAPSLLDRSKPSLSVVEGEVEVWYSGKSEANWRVCKLCVRLHVTPTLQVISWDVLPGEQPDQCYLVLDLLNRCTAGEMELIYTDDGRRILVQAEDTCRVPVPLSRCPRDLQNNDSTDVVTMLAAHASRCVQLRWLLSPQDVRCSTPLPALHFPHQTHHLMLLAPVTWGVNIGGQSVGVGGECSGKVGESVALNVSITNTSESELPPLHLTAITYQDYQNGNMNFRTEGVVASAGAMAVVLPKLGVGESYSKQVNLVFFMSGVYKLELRCCPTTPPASTSVLNTTSSTITSVTNVSSSHHHNSHHHNTQHHQSHYPSSQYQSSHHGGHSHSHSAPPSEMWVFAPAIEMAITH